MNDLYIYPTSRAARQATKALAPQHSLHTTITTIAQFLQKAIYVEDKIFIDKNKRMLFFRENIDATLFTKSEISFKLFEELAYEKIELEALLEVDTYAQYENQIMQLQTLRENYRAYLDERGYTDRFLVPQSYSLSKGYIQNFDHITFYLDGYLTQYEYDLMHEIARIVPFKIVVQIDRFSKKNIDKFSHYELESGFCYELDLSHQTSKKLHSLHDAIDAKVYCVSQRYEQIYFIFDAINKLLDSGIDAQDIAVIIPDENYKDMIKSFDKAGYLNFAMGFDFQNSAQYKFYEAIYKMLKSADPADRLRVQMLGIETQIRDTKMGVADFVVQLEQLKEVKDEKIEEKLFFFKKCYSDSVLYFHEFLYLFLQDLKQIRIDDVGGGEVTVIGALESRGATFKGVVVIDFNENYVPKINQKDIYLNSSVKAKLNLPTRSDRENLQKHLYYSIFTKAQEVYICYIDSEPKSKFLYELNLQNAQELQIAQENFFKIHAASKEIEKEVSFDAKAVIWSSTMLQVYLDCSMRFYFQYIQKIAKPQQKELNEGAILHQILAQCKEFSQEEIQKQVHHYAPNIFYQKLWIKKLQPLIQMHLSYPGKVIGREIAAQKEIAGLQFRGRADRIDLLDDATHLLIDYKSGTIANKVRNLETLTDFQMPIYAELFSEYKPNLAYLGIFDAKFEDVAALEQKSELFYSHLVKLKQTKQLQIQKCDNLAKCTYCPYTLFCKRGEYS
ncbi:MAG: PD-(D/E)XK nuclease family protein [Campylobacterota bacterium]